MNFASSVKASSTTVPIASTSPELLAHFNVRTYPALPVPLNASERAAEEYDILDIRAVGVGPLGLRMVQLLTRNLAGINCHEIIPDVEHESCGDIAALLSFVRSCDLLFILIGFDDEHCQSISQAVGRASCGAGVLTIVVTPIPVCLQDIPPQCDDGQGKWYDTMVSVSDISLPNQQGLIALSCDALIGYSMRHVAGVITNLITHTTGICIDFADLTAVMREGSVCRMGVGVTSGETRGRNAALLALERLTEQGVDIFSATGVLASVHGSSELTMDDFDAASMAIHEQISPDANVLIGLISEEQLGYNIKVTALAVHTDLDARDFPV